jgi:hypothetical protein
LAAGESSQKLTYVKVRGLAPGRYAAFASMQPPQDHTGMATFDVAKECPPTSSLGTGSTDSIPTADWTCKAKGIFEQGSDGDVSVFTIANEDESNRAPPSNRDQVNLDPPDGPFVLTIRALDNRTLTTPVTMTVDSEGRGGCSDDSAAPPKVEPYSIAD